MPYRAEMTMLKGSRRARRVLGLLLLVNVVIVVLYAGLFAIHTFVVDLPRELTHMVNLNRESTLATWFAAALLTTVAVLSILSAAVSPDPKERRGWIVLALGHLPGHRRGEPRPRAPADAVPSRG